LAGSGRFSAALAGGSTPRALYERLAGEPHRSRIPWVRVHLFWSDERPVPPNHEESNFRMAWETMISRLAIPPGNVHRIRGEIDPNDAAREYERELRGFFDLETHAELARFDLALLGMGEDGHTASLFPGSPALEEKDRWVVAPRVEKLGGSRITLTCPILENAACIIFLVTGESKAEMLKQVVQSGERSAHRPAGLIRPRHGELFWYVDRAAARDLASGTFEEIS
jgi:6-phosphogluconolactonase